MSEAKKLSLHKFNDSSLMLDEILLNVIVNHMTIENPELFTQLRKVDSEPERITEFKKVVDIGSFVKSKVEMMMDTDFIERRVAEMTNKFNSGVDLAKTQILKLVDENFDPEKSNSYTKKINRFFEDKKSEFLLEFKNTLREIKSNKEQISEEIDKSFNPNIKTSHLSKLLTNIDDFEKRIKNDFDLKKEGSISHQLKTLIEQNLGRNGEFSKVIDKKLSFDNPDSTVNLLQQNILKEIKGVKEELITLKSAAETQNAMKEKSTAKGADFEDQLLSKLEEYASINGDLVDDLTKKAGEVTRCKKGDINYVVKSLNKTIAIEARNRASSPTTPKNLIAEMEEVKVNRNADFVIYMTASEDQLHKQVGVFQLYDNDKLVTYFSLWQVALKVVISLLKLENAELDGIDKNAVEKEIETIKNSINSFKAVKTAANNIKSEAEKIFSNSDQIKNQIADSLTNLEQLLFSNEK